MLGQIPLDISLRENGDAGTPLVHADPQAPAAQALKRIAGRLFIRPHSLAGKSLGIRPG